MDELQELRETVSGLERRLKELEDSRELNELLTLYSFFADLPTRRAEWVDLWTSDGVFDVGPSRPGKVHARDRFEGREQLLQMITGDSMPPKGRSQHHPGTPILLEVDRDRAVADTYSITFVKDEDGIHPWNLGFRHWEFVREADGWKIKRCTRREAGFADPEAVIGPTPR